MDYFEEQREEIESLKAIFPDEFAEISVDPACFMVRLDELDLQSSVQIKLTLPRTYPDEIPLIEVPNRSETLPKDIVHELLCHLTELTKESIGMAMVFTIVNEAKDWINNNSERIKQAKSQSWPTTTDEQLSSDDEDEEDVSANTLYTEKGGGRWDYVIGLIGKPSAGKSTFFNAATKQNFAKIGAHPFTTIEPNISKGFYSIPCPCSSLPKRCQAVYGHDGKGWRYVPVLLKDVAGLVPGACNGRGKGNKFLNDLLDADVLIHVIDVSGETDENGKQTTGYDPTLDVEWLYNELHQWMFNNVMAKWDIICKKPSKLLEMFTGYHVTKHLIQSVFNSQGITDKKKKAFFTLNKEQSENLVHNIVGDILKVRFPILLVLNKTDRPDAPQNIKRFQEKYKDMPMVPVSAKSECFLQSLNREGEILYNGGDSEFVFREVNYSAEDSDGSLIKMAKDEAEMIDELVLKPYGSTGVLHAVSEAVLLRPPEYAFPVYSLETLESISINTFNKSSSILRYCVVLKKNTSVGKLFNILCYPPLPLFAGEFVRAECLDSTGKKRVMPKDETINEENRIVKIMSTKKGSTPGKIK